MALNKGDSDCTTGLSKRIYNHWLADARNGFSSPLSAAQQDTLKSLCWAVAQAVVEEIQANADVHLTIKTTDTGLQQYDNGGLVDTAGPAINKPLTGTVA
jgi:hypothetical protein